MKTAYIIITLALLSGCAKRPVHDSALEAAAKKYDAVIADMSKREVINFLGEPSTKEGNVYRWEVRTTAGGHASVRVQFDNADKIQGIARIGAALKR